MGTVLIIFFTVGMATIIRKVMEKTIRDNYKVSLIVFQCSFCGNNFSLTRLNLKDPRCPYDGELCNKVEITKE